MQPDRSSFEKKVIDVHGERGADWLSRLSDTIDMCERLWSIKVMHPYAPLSYNYVAPAVRADGTEVVLKLGIPRNEFRTEIVALRFFDGHGAARLLDSDSDLGAMVLERIRPGLTLSSIPDDEQATSIAAQVMKELWRTPPPEHSFPTVSDWAAGLAGLRDRFGGETGPLPNALVEKAETLFLGLIGSMGDPVLLHGDLHHYNILSSTREGWLAIDPKGVVGEREYEVGALLRNCLLSRPRPERFLEQRVNQLAEELGFERERVLGWGLAQAVLSAWWSIEDGGQVWDEAIACAEVFVSVASN